MLWATPWTFDEHRSPFFTLTLCDGVILFPEAVFSDDESAKAIKVHVLNRHEPLLVLGDVLPKGDTLMFRVLTHVGVGLVYSMYVLDPE